MKKGIVGSISAGAIISLGSLLFPQALHAQGSSESPSTGQPTEYTQPQQTFSDQDLQAFAKAYPEVEKVAAEHKAALGQVQDPAQAQQLQQEATAKMVEAVQKEGLTAETYNQILIATQSDAALAQKVNQLIEKEKAS